MEAGFHRLCLSRFGQPARTMVNELKGESDPPESSLRDLMSAPKTRRVRVVPWLRPGGPERRAKHLSRETDGPRLVRPLPAGGLRLIRAVLEGVITTRNLFVQEFFPGVGANGLKPGHALDHIHRQAEAIDFIFDGQF